MSFLFLIFLFLHSNVVIQLHSSCTSGSTLELVVESYNSLYFLRFCWGIIISIFFFYLGYETQQFTCKSCWCLKDWWFWSCQVLWFTQSCLYSSSRYKVRRAVMFFLFFFLFSTSTLSINLSSWELPGWRVNCKIHLSNNINFGG